MTSDNKRCVVTGIGMISAIGNNVEECWKNAINAVCGIKETHSVDTKNCYVNLAGEVKDESLNSFPGAESFDRSAILCIKASSEAMKDAGLTSFEGNHRAGVIMGSCVGGINSIEDYYVKDKPVSDITQMPISAIANSVAITFKAGGIITNIGNACAAGTISIAYACDLIRSGKADVVIAGGADVFGSVPYAGFLSLHALSEQKCSPFNHCNGITLGEGSGAVIVESFEHAQKRNAKMYCEVLGAGVSSDAFHITTPRPDGEGQMYAIRKALSNSGINPEEIGYINAHGTGTAKNDEAEFLSLHTIFDEHNDNLSVSSTKAMIGHCLGAAGAVEAVFSIKALTEGIIPPTIGYSEEDIEVLKEKAGKIDFCPNVSKKKELTSVMNNSFAFGGNNASIIFSKQKGNVSLPEQKERIFITGIGVVSVLGNSLESYLEKMKEGTQISELSSSSIVGTEDYQKCGLKMAFYRKLDNFSHIQAVSAMNALSDAALQIDETNATDVGIVVGTSDGPLSTVCDYQMEIVAKGNADGSAFKFPNTVYNAAGGYLSICSGIRGYNVTLTNGAQSGLSAIAYAMDVIRDGQEKAVLATGTDENTEIMTELYSKLGVLSVDGDGFCLSDGSTTLVLESESGMKERNATAYAEVKGYGMACHPVTFGTVSGSDEALDEAVKLAFIDANIDLNMIDGVVGFANGKLAIDSIEANGIKRIFGSKAASLPVINIRKAAGEGRAAAAALSAAHAALLLSGKLGDKTEADFYTDNGVSKGSTDVSALRNLLVISVGAGGSYTAIIISK